LDSERGKALLIPFSFGNAWQRLSTAAVFVPAEKPRARRLLSQSLDHSAADASTALPRSFSKG
jgi:hypothetical protein